MKRRVRIGFILFLLGLLFLLTGCGSQSFAEPSGQDTLSTSEAGNSPTCSIVIDCSVLLDHLDELDEAKHPLVPEDGILLNLENVSFTQGETVFDVVSRELKAQNLHYEITGTAVTAYFQAIGNLYEFDCGPLSGWEYRMNDEYPGVGCGAYLLSDGDAIAWYYSCDLGRDIGNDFEE